MDDKSDGMVVVLGVTGAGKSYFINCLKVGSAKEGKCLRSGKQRKMVVSLVVMAKQQQYQVPTNHLPTYSRNHHLPGDPSPARRPGRW